MSKYYPKDDTQLHYCIYRTLLQTPRLSYLKAAKCCGVSRNTFTKHWEDGLDNLIFFLPQMRLDVFEDKREYIYLVQNKKAHELFKYYKKDKSVVYLAYTVGNFNLLIQTNKPLEILPDRTLFFGSRENYIFPEVPFHSFDTALEKMEAFLEERYTPSSIYVPYSKEPEIEGSEWAWKIFPYLKYNLRANYTFIVKKLGISFTSFYKGYDYLSKVSTTLLPFYPLGQRQYLQNFLVFWTDYEEVIRDFFSLLPCHVSIVKVDDILLVYTSTLREQKFYSLCYKLLELGFAEQFWVSMPLFHWVPDP